LGYGGFLLELMVGAVDSVVPVLGKMEDRDSGGRRRKEKSTRGKNIQHRWQARNVHWDEDCRTPIPLTLSSYLGMYT
jgi:hypothetical protein